MILQSSECEEREYLTKQQPLWSIVFLIFLCCSIWRVWALPLGSASAAVIRVILPLTGERLLLFACDCKFSFMSSAGRNGQSMLARVQTQGCNVCFSEGLCHCEKGLWGHWVRAQLCKRVRCPMAGAVCQVLPAPPDPQVWRPGLLLLWRCVAKNRNHYGQTLPRLQTDFFSSPASATSTTGMMFFACCIYAGILGWQARLKCVLREVLARGRKTKWLVTGFLMKKSDFSAYHAYVFELVC